MKKKTYRYLTLILTILLGCWRGYVALLEEGNAQPVQVYPYQVRSLPPADRALLKKGIPITSREQLQMLLEDYLS